MHEETLTALYESGEKTQQYLAKIEHAIGRVLEALIPQALPLRHPEKKLETSPTKIEPDAERSEDDDPDLQLMKETIQVARSLADTISNRGSVVGRSSSGQVAVYRRVSPEVDHEASDEEFSMPEDSASNEEFPVGFRASLMPMSMTMTSLDELPDAHNERFGAFRHESSHGGQGIGENLPAELMTQLLDNYILAAEADLRARRFPEAQQNLFHATQKGERRESIYSYPFDEKLKIDIIQAAVHTELEEFDVAGPMLDSLVPLTGEDSLKRGELYYLKAKLYRAQYRRTQDAALLEGLEEAAERSYSFALNSDVFPKPYLCQSKDILVEVFEWKGDSVGADSIRDLHPPVSTPVPNHLDDVAADQPAKASARFINGRHYSLGSQAARRVPSLSTVQSAYSRDDRTMSVGSMPTGTAPTSYLRPIASAGLIDRIQDGDLKTVKMLLTIGANIEQVDEVTGLTPLLIAARCQHTEICRVLLTNKADVHAKSRDGRSVLHIALSRRGGEDLIPVLLEHEADPNIADEDGKTPLHYCAKSNKRLAAKHLLDAKAEKEALTKTTKETALQLAIRRNNPALVEILLDAGATIDRSPRSSTSQDIEFIIDRHLGRISDPARGSVVTRQQSTSTVLSNSTTGSGASRRSWLRPHRIFRGGPRSLSLLSQP